jgi:hypothetical protein
MIAARMSNMQQGARTDLKPCLNLSNVPRPFSSLPQLFAEVIFYRVQFWRARVVSPWLWRHLLCHNRLRHMVQMAIDSYLSQAWDDLSNAPLKGRADCGFHAQSARRLPVRKEFL